MPTFKTGLPLEPHERPRTRSVAESLGVMQAKINGTHKRKRVWQPPQQRGRNDDLLNRGSQAEAQESQRVATKRYDPHGYD